MSHELRIASSNKEMVIAKRIKQGRLWWAGHVARMPEKRQATAIFCRETGRDRRLRGRLNIHWLFGVEEDLMTLNVQGDLKRMAQDRDQWKRLLDSA